ncbi:MAG TPA: hypothetical protein VFW33_02545 [Gemmataceae bacterium]|nr:hypothetical protein [Gemmataceae bacterium]
MSADPVCTEPAPAPAPPSLPSRVRGYALAVGGLCAVAGAVEGAVLGAVGAAFGALVAVAGHYLGSGKKRRA